MTTRGFLIGILIGTTVGAAVGLLYAPQEGATTRRRISDTAKNARDKVGDIAGTVKSKVMRRSEKIEQSI